MKKSFFSFIIIFLLAFFANSNTQAQHSHHREETGIERSVRITNQFLFGRDGRGNDTYYCNRDRCNNYPIDRYNYNDHYNRYHSGRYSSGNRYAETGRLTLEAFLQYLLERKKLNITEKVLVTPPTYSVSALNASPQIADSGTLPIAEYFADPANFRQNMNILGIKIYTKDNGEMKLITTISLGETWKRVAKEYRTVFFKALVNTGQEEQEVELKPVYSGQFKYKLALK